MICYQQGTANLPWPELYALYDQVGLVANLAARREYASIRAAFEQSFCVVTALDGDRLVGAGRMLSDGRCYGLIVDVGVLAEQQNRQGHHTGAGGGRAAPARVPDTPESNRSHRPPLAF